MACAHAVCPPGAFCVTNANDAGPGSLRQAILNSNTNIVSTSVIAFDIPGSGPFTIHVGAASNSPLPVITNPVIIDGYTQSGAQSNTNVQGDNATLMIELDGTLAAFTNGLTIQANSCAVRGLVINRFTNGAGIFLQATTNCHVEGNFIGTDVNGANAQPNRFGIQLTDAHSNLIGGNDPTNRNLISGNKLLGVYLVRSGTNSISGNYIGTDTSGANALANGGAQSWGIEVDGAYTILGGTNQGDGNVVAFNTNAIYVSTNVAILGNSIFSNAVQGIYLQGFTNNDSCDGDGLQNFPVLTSAFSGSRGTEIRGFIDSTSHTDFRLEFFACAIGDTNGYGEGQMFLGFAEVNPGSDCQTPFVVDSPTSLSTTWVVTATATDLARSETSQFSQWLAVAPSPPVAGFSATPTSGTAPLPVSFTNLSVDASVYAWDFGDGVQHLQ